MSSKHTYTSFHEWHGWRSFASSVRNDIKTHWSGRHLRQRVNSLLEDARAIEQLLFGRQLKGADVLDVGPGQVPIQLMYFSRNNRAVGIDVDRIIHDRTPRALLQVARESGSLRALKMMGRWILSDRRMRRYVAQSLAVKNLSWPEILQMDVQEMGFPDQSFDLVYSRSVLQHIKDPSRAIQQIRRVLKPGGGVYISVHLWTCPNGYTFAPAATWEWPHLRGLTRPHEIDRARNQLRLAEWRKLFEREFPGCELRLRGPETPAMIERAIELRRTELIDYSMEELINYEVTVSWRKHSNSTEVPAGHAPFVG